MANPFAKKTRLGPDRMSGVLKGGRIRQRRIPKLLRHKWAVTALVVVVLVAVVVAWAAWLFVSTESGTQKPIANVGNKPKPEGKPQLVLLVGSDSRAGLTEKEQHDLGADDVSAAGPVAGQRADTLIIAQIDPETDHITMVQFPRDLWVTVRGEKARINSALQSGEAALVDTVESLTGLEIDHYVQINIAGFKDLVDAIGGVNVCVPEPIEFDPATGIQVEHPGLIHFDGERAVRFVRSRKTVAGGDLGRIQNQQKFMAAAIDKITSVDTLLHLQRINEIRNVLQDNVTLDEGTGLIDLYRMGQRFKSFDPRNYEAYTVPNLGPSLVGDASVVRPDMSAMKVMFKALSKNESPAEADRVPDIDPDTIRVGVYNGTYEEGVAASAARALERATRTSQGDITVDRANISNAPRFDYEKTWIVYNRSEPRAKEMAEFVSAAVPEAGVRKGKTDPEIDVAVIVGPEPFKTKKVVQILPLPIPKPGAEPRACRR